MSVAITCGDRHASADLDTYEHGTMVQVRCECKANFYAWSMQGRAKDGASVPLAVPLAVPVAGLSDNETIHKIKCEVCPEVRAVQSPPARMRCRLPLQCPRCRWHAHQTSRRARNRGASAPDRASTSTRLITRRPSGRCVSTTTTGRPSCASRAARAFA